MKIQIPYYRKREALLFMLKHYKANCEKYIELDLRQSDIQVLIEFDTEYIRHYEKELEILDKTFLN
jgi:hypothetical protein